MKLLLTAFDPFGGEPINPALEAVKLVSDTVGSVQVIKLEVPTVFGKSIDKVAKAIETEKPGVPSTWFFRFLLFEFSNPVRSQSGTPLPSTA